MQVSGQLIYSMAENRACLLFAKSYLYLCQDEITMKGTTMSAQLKSDTIALKLYLLGVPKHYRIVKRIITNPDMSYESRLKSLNAVVHLDVKHEVSSQDICIEKTNLFALLDHLLENQADLFPL